jgi:hypothetical protein
LNQHILEKTTQIKTPKNKPHRVSSSQLCTETTYQVVVIAILILAMTTENIFSSSAFWDFALILALAAIFFKMVSVREAGNLIQPNRMCG